MVAKGGFLVPHPGPLSPRVLFLGVHPPACVCFAAKSLYLKPFSEACPWAKATLPAQAGSPPARC